MELWYILIICELEKYGMIVTIILISGNYTYLNKIGHDINIDIIIIIVTL